MEHTPSALVVDDSPEAVEVVERNLTSRNLDVVTASSVDAAIEVLNRRHIDLVITDLKMPKVTGMELVRHVRSNYPRTAIMMITGHATVDTAVEAMKFGAEEYLAKPFTDDELFGAVGRALEKQRLQRLSGASESAGSLSTTHGMVGTSVAMRAVYTAIEKTASTTATVLIEGESGSGKELVARAIHYAGPRASAPFVAVNCGAIPEQLVESELFGHKKGAFTGATDSREGFFRAAHGGTIFLDEISELAPAIQVKLLRVLQENEVVPVGGETPRAVDLRVLAATNKDLEALVAKGTFRQDLFFRVSVVNIRVPPLRDREDDILLLIDQLSAKLSRISGRPRPSFSDDALGAMRDYSWPGNVRELENVLQRLIVMGEDGHPVEISALPSQMRFRLKSRLSLRKTLAEVETDHILAVLADVGGNKTRAAQILGIDRKTLREKLKAITSV